MTVEIDLKEEQSPTRFWSILAGTVLAMSAGSGGTAYTLAQQATEDTARAVADQVVRTRLKEFETNTRTELRELRREVRGQGLDQVQMQNDLKWIRRSLERLERRRTPGVADE